MRKALLAHFSLLCQVSGRFFLARRFFANRNCDGCGICAENGPVGAIEMKGQDPKWPFWRCNCESCMKCAAFCPHNAIEAGQSWALTLSLPTFTTFTHIPGWGRYREPAVKLKNLSEKK